MFWSQIPKDCPQALAQLAWNCVAYYPQDRPPFKEIMTRVRIIERDLGASSPVLSTFHLDPPSMDGKRKPQTEKYVFYFICVLLNFVHFILFLEPEN